MRIRATIVSTFVLLATSCAPSDRSGNPATTQATAGAVSEVEPNALESLHVRLVVNPDDGAPRYLGWYDGRRNLLGPEGISAAIVGVPPPEFCGKLSKPGPNELLFEGIDQNDVAWVKRYRLDDSKVSVTYKVTNRRDQGFDAIVYSMADLPDATITGDNRDQHIKTPQIRAHFHAVIDDPNFPGEQMNPYALRSDSKRLEPGDSMEFKMTWELLPARQ